MLTSQLPFRPLRLALFGTLSVAAAANAQPDYDFILVDSFNPTYSLRETYLWDINDRGVACGITTAPNTFGYPGFVWSESQGKTIVPVSYPRGINNSGLVVGHTSAYELSTGHSYTLPMLPATYIGPTLGGVNDAGVAVGFVPTCNCSNSGGVQQIPYVWDAANGARTVFVPGAKGLSRINNAGVAIGWLNGNSSADGFSVDLETGAVTLLNDVFPTGIGLAPTRALDINDAGSIVGTRIGTTPVYFYGYVYTPGQGVQILPFPAEPYQQAVKPFGINNAGVIVGEIYIGGSSRAFVYSADSGIRDLNDAALVAGIPSGYLLMTAQKINEQGWIVGYGYGGGGMYKSYVLKPRALPCPADFNHDGGVDGDDVIAFFAAWDGSLSVADLNGDGGVDGDDVIAFFRSWDAGC